MDVPFEKNPLGNLKTPEGFRLVKSLVVNTNYQVFFRIPNITYSDYVYHFSGYTSNASRFMLGSSWTGTDSIWQGEGTLIWGRHVCSISSNAPIDVILGKKNESFYNGKSLGVMGNDLVNSNLNYP